MFKLILPGICCFHCQQMFVSAQPDDAQSYNIRTRLGSETESASSRIFAITSKPCRMSTSNFFTLLAIHLILYLEFVSNSVGYVFRKWRFSDVMVCNFQSKMVVSYNGQQIIEYWRKLRAEVPTWRKWNLYTMDISVSIFGVWTSKKHFWEYFTNIKTFEKFKKRVTFQRP